MYKPESILHIFILLILIFSVNFPYCSAQKFKISTLAPISMLLSFTASLSLYRLQSLDSTDNASTLACWSSSLTMTNKDTTSSNTNTKSTTHVIKMFDKKDLL